MTSLEDQLQDKNRVNFYNITCVVSSSLIGFLFVVLLQNTDFMFSVIILSISIKMFPSIQNYLDSDV